MNADEIAGWRRETRETLLDRRKRLTSAERAELARPMLVNLNALLETLRFQALGIYWPIHREIDVRPLAEALSGSRGFKVALPVVVQKRAPLEYWRWSMGEPTRPGVWNIPVPAERELVRPDVVLAPLVGFRGHFRLGYGAGYFDRTLAAARPSPFAIGLGFEFSRLDDFIAQPHDVPMDAIVTEAAVYRREKAGGAVHGHP